MKFPAFEPIDLKNNVNHLSIIEISTSKIFPNPEQPRKYFKQETLKELALSIKTHGVIQPIIVREIELDKYQIIAGERRWRASCLVELEVIPVIIQDNENKKNVAISLIENIQREELNPMELAESFSRLSGEYNLSHEEIALMVGKNRATVTNFLRLLNLAEEVKSLLIKGKLEMGHARSLLALPLETQESLANDICAKKLTVRETEKLVRLNKKPIERKNTLRSEKVEVWRKKLSQSISSKVAMKINENGEGKVTIHFSSFDEINEIVEHFSRKREQL